MPGSLVDLKYADGTTSSAGLTISNAAGSWGSGAADYMYDGYLYPSAGGNVVVTVTNLNAGTYDLYIYGHGAADNQNSTYQLNMGSQSYGGQTTLNGPGWNSSTVWQDGLQYVEFTNVVVSAGQTVIVTVLPASSSFAIIAGMQIAQVGLPIVAPVVTTQPVSQTVTAGANVTFNVGVSGSASLSYQWQYGGNNISGATGTSLTLTNVQVSNGGNYSVTVTNAGGSTTSSNAALTVNPIIVSTNGLPLIDVDFGSGTATTEVGFAATGQTTNDFWNFYTRDDGNGGYLTFGSLVDLKHADGTTSSAGLTISNAAGSWGTGAADYMYDGYLYPSAGGNVVVTVTNLNAGTYDLYIYGHGAADNQNSTYQLSVGSLSYGNQTTLNGPGWGSSAVWQDGLQYVEFTNVVVGAGQNVTVTVLPASSSYAIIAGMQIAQISTNALPLLDVDFGSGTATAEVGFAATGQSTNDFWNFYTRDDGNGGYLTFGSLSGMKYADGSASGAGLTIANAPGSWGNGAADYMYDGYLYCFDGNNITVVVTNLAAGSYDLYVYGHGAADNQNSTYQLSVNSQSYGSQTTLSGPGWGSSAVWQDGLQYVEFSNVVVGAGQTVTITVLPADSSYAIISGLQIAQVVASAPVAPVVTTQPVSQTVTAGANVTFNVGVSGSAPLSYQWQYGGSNISGATGTSLILTNVQVGSGGNYSVTVTNAGGSTTSSNAVLTVNPIIVLTNGLPLIDVQFCALDNPNSLKDRKTGIAATGQTANDYWNAYSRDGTNGGFLTYGVLNNLELADGTLTSVGLTVANAPGAWSNDSSDPMYATYLYPFDGGDITVTITNLNAGTYDFYIYGHGAADDQNSIYELSVNGQSYGSQANLNGPGWNTVVWQQGVQYVEFQNVVIGAGQGVTITVLPGDGGYAVISGLQIAQVVMSAPVAPVVTTQPASQTVTVGANVTFNVGVTGSAPLSYQWQYGGNNISGATGASLILTNVQVGNGGNYSVTVTNAGGSTTSSNAVLTVNPVIVSTNGLPLIDVDFGSGTAAEVGFAATGQTTNDFWNFYTRDDGNGGYLTFGSLTGMKYADGSASGAGFTIANAPGSWGNGAADYMYDGYLYPFDGGEIVVTVTNLVAGSYDLYVYGHGDADNQNSTYQLSVGSLNYGSETTLNGPGWNSSAVWQEGLQYVEFSNVVVSAGQPLTITVLPANSSYAIISGLQIAQVAASAPVAPVVTTQPTNQTVTAGASVIFNVGVSGSFPLFYQWRYGGSNISEATGTSLILTNMQVGNGGNYSVTVTNAAGSTTSSKCRADRQSNHLHAGGQ